MCHYACSSIAQEAMFLGGGGTLAFGRMSANAG